MEYNDYNLNLATMLLSPLRFLLPLTVWYLVGADTDKCSKEELVSGLYPVPCAYHPDSPTAKIHPSGGPVLLVPPTALISAWITEYEATIDADDPRLGMRLKVGHAQNRGRYGLGLDDGLTLTAAPTGNTLSPLRPCRNQTRFLVLTRSWSLVSHVTNHLRVQCFFFTSSSQISNFLISDLLRKSSRNRKKTHKFPLKLAVTAAWTLLKRFDRTLNKVDEYNYFAGLQYECFENQRLLMDII